MAAEPTEKWRIETNDRYNKVVTSIISLATGTLVLPDPRHGPVVILPPPRRSLAPFGQLRL